MVVVKCSKCQAKLKVKLEPGKKLKCPKCGNVSRAPGGPSGQPKRPATRQRPASSAPAPAQQDVPDFSDAMEGDVIDIPDLSRTRSRASTSTKAKTDSNQTLLLAGGGGVVALLIAAICTYLFWPGEDGPAESPPVAATNPQPTPPADSQPKIETPTQPAPRSASGWDLRYLPENPPAVAALRLADLLASPAIQLLLSSPDAQKGLRESEEQLGLSLSNMDQIILCGEMTSLADAAPLIKIHTKTAFDQDKFLQGPGGAVSTATHGDVQYYRAIIKGDQPAVPTPDQSPGSPPGLGPLPGMDMLANPMDSFAGEQVAIWFADEKTILFGQEQMVKDAISRGAGAPKSGSPLLALLDDLGSQHFALVATPELVEDLGENLPIPGVGGPTAPGGEPVVQGPPSAMEKITSFGLGVALTDDIQISLLGDCSDDSQAAGQIKTELTKLLDQGKALVQLQRMQVQQDTSPFAQQTLAGVTAIESLLNGINVDVAGTRVRVDSKIVTASIPQMFGFVMQQMLGGEVEMAENASDSLSFPSEQPKQAPAASVVESGVQKDLLLSNKAPFGVHAPSGSKPLFATVELKGEVAREASSYGFLRLEKATDDTGKVLKLVKDRFGFQDDPTSRFIELNRGFMFAGEFNPPKDVIKIHLMLDPATEGAKQLTAIEGSFQLLVGGQKKTIIVDGIAGKLDEPLDSPELAEAELRITPKKPANDGFVEADKALTFEVKGPSHNLSEMVLVDTQGEQATSGTMSTGSGETKVMTLMSDDKLPENVKLKVVVLVGQKPVEVPFKFDSAALPTDKPN